jgi:O-antigen/teichoic acid export membrane protein
MIGTGFAVLVALRSQVLNAIGGADARSATTVLIVVAIGYAVSGILFWNTSLLFASGRSKAVSAVAVASGGLQVALLVPLTAAYGAAGAAAALCASLVVSNLVAAVLGIRALSGAEEALLPTASRAA